VAALTQLVASPTLAPLLAYLVRPREDPQAESVALIEQLSDLRAVPERAVVLLTRRASAHAGSYRFDAALRVARSRKTAALILSGGELAELTPTAPAIASRSGTAILATGAGVDLAQLAVAIARELEGDADAALVRAHAALRTIRSSVTDGRPDVLLERASAALGVPVTQVEAEPRSGPHEAIRLDERVEGRLAAPPQVGSLGLAVDIVLHAAAAGVAQITASTRRAAELPLRSREEVLSELLAAPMASRSTVVQRARTLGLAIDGWHVAARLESESLADLPAGQELAAYDARVRFARAALRALQEHGGSWHSARLGPALVLIRMDDVDPGSGAAGRVAVELDDALAAARSQRPTTVVHCGVGSAYRGPAGLVASAAEARAAVTAARAAGRMNVAVPFDSAGLRRTLVEWYASDTAQEAVSTVLAPLERVGGARAERLIKTLHVYLDKQGSLTRTAEVLNLHRNAVGYRIDQVFELLDVDRDNPDDLLLLQLACRARELGTTMTP
jgi:sugar diacid utilization regulator